MPLDLKNWPRFLPAIWRYAGKLRVKANRKLFNHNASTSNPETPRLQLWRDEETQEMLDPPGMRLASLIDPLRLTDFLESSRQPQFAFDQQWRRVLTVEMALRLLDDVRKENQNPARARFA
jgi:hypothetical protein